MKEKISVMTSFGPVPYSAVKNYLPKEVIELIKSNMKELESESFQLALSDEEYYIHMLAEKKKWEPYKMVKYIENLTKFNPAAAALVLLREIAIDFDNNHKGNIEDSEEIWTISMLNGKIEQIDKTKVKNYRNFPAFRSKEEAKEAHAILSNRLKKMFKGCNE